MQPTPYQITSLALLLSKKDPQAQLARAYDLLVEADQLIKTRLADAERKQAEHLGQTFVAELIGNPITLDDVIKKALIPKAVGKKGVETSIRTKKGLIMALERFFAVCIPTPPSPETASTEQRKRASEKWLAEIIKGNKIPRHLIEEFKQWRSTVKKLASSPP